MKNIYGLFVLVSFLAWSAPAMATIYSSPVPNVDEGQPVVGGYYSQTSRTVKIKDISVNNDLYQDYLPVSLKATWEISRTSAFGGYGIEKGMLLGNYAITEIEDTIDGSEFGITYRHKVGETTDIKEKKFNKGFFGSYHMGTFSDDVIKGSYSMIELGFGGEVSLTKEVSTYVSVIFSQLDGKVDAEYVYISPLTKQKYKLEYSYKFKSDQNLGLYAGLGYAIDTNIRVGAEYHLVFENGFGIFFEYKL